MRPYKRPEMETDPAKLPGQIVNQVPDALVARPRVQRMEDHKREYRARTIWEYHARTIADIVRRIQREESNGSS